MAKILYCASTWSHLKQFHLPYINYFRDQGDEVHLAAASLPKELDGCYLHPLQLEKRLVSPRNLKTVAELSRLLRQENFDTIHIHTSLAAFLIRAALLLSHRRGERVIYTCHGYFFEAEDTGRVRRSLRSLFYLACEKALSRFTDQLVLMNHVDYQSAIRYQLAPQIFFSHGMGLNQARCLPLCPGEGAQLRAQLHINREAVVFGCVGEFSKRKNQPALLRAFHKVQIQVPASRLLLAGEGARLTECRALAEQLEIAHKVFFLGFLPHIHLFYEALDVLVAPSRSEGLPFNVMEGLHYKIPIIATRIKGHTDLIQHMENGVLYSLGDERELAEQMTRMALQPQLRQQLSEAACLPGQYALDHVFPENLALFNSQEPGRVPVPEQPQEEEVSAV